MSKRKDGPLAQQFNLKQPASQPPSCPRPPWKNRPSTHHQRRSLCRTNRPLTFKPPPTVTCRARPIVRAPNLWNCRDGAWCTPGRICAVRPGAAADWSLLLHCERLCRGTARAVSVVCTANRNNKQNYIPVTIGAYTVIGTGSQIRAAAVGSLCWLGQNSGGGTAVHSQGLLRRGR